MNSLRESAVSGVKWHTMSATFAAVTAIIFQLVKARLLTPEEFAYLSVLMIIIGLSRNLEVAGFNRGIIQREQVTTEEASSLFIFNLVLSLFAAAVIYFAGAPVATFFALPGLDNHIRIISLAVFFQGLGQFFLAFLEKFFYFKAVAVIQMARQLLFVALSITLIALGWGVLGFVLGHVTATIFSALLFIAGGLINRVTSLKLFFRPGALGPFVRFGLYLTGRQTLGVISRQVDELIILHFLGPEVMGIYFFGKNMLERLRYLLSMSFHRVVFPLLSRLQHDRARLAEAYYKMTRYISLAALPVFTGIMLTAHLFVPVIFGAQWADSIIVFQVFSLTLVLKMLSDVLGANLLYSVNRPDTVFSVDLVTDLVYILALLLFAPWGLNVVIMLYVVYQVIKALAVQVAVHRQITLPLSAYPHNFKGPLALSLAMAAAVWGFQQAAAGLAGAFLLAASILVGAAVYLALTFIFDRDSIKQIRELTIQRTPDR